MTFSKILATTAIVGMMGSAAFANDINFEQSGGSVKAVTFTQAGVGNMISSNGTAKDMPAMVVGSLEMLNLEQRGDSNKSSFSIAAGIDSGSETTPALGIVSLLLDGSDNTSSLSVNQVGSGTLNFKVGVQGIFNTVDANITAAKSVVNLESKGADVDYEISQTSADVGANHNITAVIDKQSGMASVQMLQSGKTNTITLGTPSASYGAFNGTPGMTLQGPATVYIAQSSENASYTATQTVAPAGFVTIAQN